MPVNLWVTFLYEQFNKSVKLRFSAEIEIEMYMLSSHPLVGKPANNFTILTFAGMGTIIIFYDEHLK